ncbi:hypothetical protein [Aeromicrobium yanjiei]|uniref:Uncharacterized protein n=1 Tax=Aeromicrobium yanjiei TaxID=2662028 RepID=A0A5Q2MQV3_9ACTN|nr:hypothetical protein [Aeromicrobium yanjiei]QGG42780.1 hypothetical protein GEV26_16135 [Aeromicrobium yanjiei]
MDPDARLGTAPAFGGSGSGAHIELTIEEVEKIGRATAALNERAQAARTELADAAGGGGFSSYPSAQALFDQHQAVVEVFDKTLAAMTTDLDDFGSTIVQAAHNHDQTDNDVLATMAMIAAKVDTASLIKAHEQARNEAGHRLQEPDTDLDTTPEIDAFDEENPSVKEPSLDGLRSEEAPSIPTFGEDQGEDALFDASGGAPK